MLGDVLEVRLVGLRVLLVERDVLALLEAAFLEAIDEALVRRVEGVVLDELDDADLVRLAAGACALLRAAAAGEDACREERGRAEREELHFL